MADLKGTKTEENLKAALAGESQARVKYEFYASQAKKDGYVEIKDIFQESSDNEKEHAKIWFKLLHDGKVPDTLSNLADAAAGEHYGGLRICVPTVLPFHLSFGCVVWSV